MAKAIPFLFHILVSKRETCIYVYTAWSSSIYFIIRLRNFIMIYCMCLSFSNLAFSCSWLDFGGGSSWYHPLEYLNTNKCYDYCSYKNDVIKWSIYVLYWKLLTKQPRFLSRIFSAQSFFSACVTLACPFNYHQFVQACFH